MNPRVAFWHHARPHGRVTIESAAATPDAPEILVEPLPGGAGWALRLPALGRTCGRFATETDAIRAAARSGYRLTLAATRGDEGEGS